MVAADLYCQSNTGPEGFGLALVESLRAGLPVITSDFGGAAEIVNGVCGVLCPPGDAAAVAAALRGLIADPDRRRMLGAAGPRRAAELCDPARQLTALAAATGGVWEH
jgi:glycosyltransferase involved in cell wall biosynthesis